MVCSFHRRALFDHVATIRRADVMQHIGVDGTLLDNSPTWRQVAPQYSDSGLWRKWRAERVQEYGALFGALFGNVPGALDGYNRGKVVRKSGSKEGSRKEKSCYIQIMY